MIIEDNIKDTTYLFTAEERMRQSFDDCETLFWIDDKQLVDLPHSMPVMHYQA